MAEKEYRGLMALASLQRKLDADASLEVMHEGGYSWQASFAFAAPASPDELQKIKAELPFPLPAAYEQFLLLSDGALLYHDKKYGQWGFSFYGVKELREKNRQWSQRYSENWSPYYFVFAEALGDADLLLLDGAKPTRDGLDCRVMDGDSGYLPNEWDAASRSFDEWLDHLIIAQGAKYWRWY
jgi:hypothetical protein